MIDKIWDVVNGVIQFVFPYLEDSKTKKCAQDICIELQDCKFSDSEVDTVLKYMEEYVISEDHRRKNVEFKASIFVGSFSVATSILINFAKELIPDTINRPQCIQALLAFAIVFIIIYLTGAMCFSIKSLGRGNYHSVGMPEFLWAQDLSEVSIKRRIFVEEYNDVIKNRSVINKKVDYMTLAQEWFIRAAVIVALISILLAGMLIWNFFCKIKM